MKQKKTMRLWQMILIMVLSVAMLATMFLPAFKFDGAAFTKAQEKNPEKAEDNKEKEIAENFPIVGDLIEAVDAADKAYNEADFEQNLKTYESENGVKIHKISSLNIMTHSFVKLVGQQYVEDQKLEEDTTFISIQKKYNIVRIFLWVVYGLLLVVLVMTILGFALKWSKFIPLIIDAFYGLIAAGLFGYMRFMLMGGIAKVTGEELFERIAYGYLKDANSAMLGSFYSFAFLVALIVAALILIASVIFMLVGNSAESEWEYDEEEEPSEIPGIGFAGGVTPGVVQPGQGISGEQHYFGGGDSVYSGSTETVKQEPPKQKKAVRQPMGQVRCTKGDAVGMGYALPQDRKVIVGKSPQNANLVINNQNVSNIHCSIRYDATTNMYLVKDHSMNGTFVNGSRLQKDVMLQFPAGTVLSLADGSNQITLG